MLSGVKISRKIINILSSILSLFDPTSIITYRTSLPYVYNPRTKSNHTRKSNFPIENSLMSSCVLLLFIYFLLFIIWLRCPFALIQFIKKKPCLLSRNILWNWILYQTKGSIGTFLYVMCYIKDTYELSALINLKGMVLVNIEKRMSFIPFS